LVIAQKQEDKIRQIDMLPASMRTLSLILLLATASLADDFDNWYFNTLAQGGTSTSRYLDKNGNEIESAKGSGSGKLSEDGKSFVEIGEETRDQSEEKITFQVRWTKVGPKSFKGILTDNKKGRSVIKMNLKKNNLVEFKQVTAQNYSIQGLGRLQKDGKIYFQSNGFHLDAPELSFSVVSWFRPKKK